MPTYILLSTLTPEGRQTLHKNPDRLDEVNREIEEFGCRPLTEKTACCLSSMKR